MRNVVTLACFQLCPSELLRAYDSQFVSKWANFSYLTLIKNRPAPFTFLMINQTGIKIHIVLLRRHYLVNKGLIIDNRLQKIEPSLLPSPEIRELLGEELRCLK